MIRAFAYLDAGTGSLIIQAVGGAAVATVVFIKGFGRRIKSALTFKKNKKESTDATSK